MTAYKHNKTLILYVFLLAYIHKKKKIKISFISFQSKIYVLASYAELG